jgi:hypothetical protein
MMRVMAWPQQRDMARQVFQHRWSVSGLIVRTRHAGKFRRRIWGQFAAQAWLLRLTGAGAATAQ